MRRVVAIAAGLMLAWVVRPGAASPPPLEVVPADATWIVHTDFDALRNAPVVARLGEMIVPRPDARRGMQRIWGLLGVDPATQLHGLAFFGRRLDEPKPPLLAIQADIDREKLVESIARMPEYRAEEYHGRTIHRYVYELRFGPPGPPGSWPPGSTAPHRPGPAVSSEAPAPEPTRSSDFKPGKSFAPPAPWQGGRPREGSGRDRPGREGSDRDVPGREGSSREPPVRNGPPGGDRSRGMMRIEIAGCLVEPGLFLYGHDVESLQASLDVVDRRAPGLPEDSPLRLSVPRGTAYYIAAVGVNQTRLPFRSPIPRHSDRVGMVAGQEGEEVFFRGRLTALSVEAAEQLQAVIEGFRAGARLDAAGDPEAAATLAALKIARHERDVEVTARAQQAQVIRLLDILAPPQGPMFHSETDRSKWSPRND